MGGADSHVTASSLPTLPQPELRGVAKEKNRRGIRSLEVEPDGRFINFIYSIELFILLYSSSDLRAIINIS